MLAYRKHNPRRYRGYKTPFENEVYSERLFVEELQRGGKSVLPFKLFPVKRQADLEGKQIIDLLALDETAAPWIFEFKRDIADFDAISQILAYGSNVVNQDMDFFEASFAGKDKRRSLRKSFQSHFGRPLPDHPPGQIRMVIAAYDFSTNCRQVLDFLENTTGLIIGRLSIKCILDSKGTTSPEYCWLKKPSLTKTPIQHRGNACPEIDHWVSMDAGKMALTWEECIENKILPISFSRKPATESLEQNHGIFVYLRNTQANQQQSHQGLAAYGIVRDSSFDLFDREDEIRLSIESTSRLNSLPQPFNVLPVHWLHSRLEGRQCSTIKDLLGEDTSSHAHCRIRDKNLVESFKASFTEKTPSQQI